MSRNVQPPWQEAPEPPAGGSGVTPPDEQGTDQFTNLGDWGTADTARLVEVGPSYGDTAAHVAAQLVGHRYTAWTADDPGLQQHLDVWQAAAERVYAWLASKQPEQEG